MRSLNVADAAFLGSAAAGVLVAYGASLGSVVLTAACLSAPVFAFQVVRRLNVTDIRKDDE